jgi:hypothetical protein
MTEPAPVPTASLDRLRNISQVWDNLVRIPIIGRRIGLDALVGLIPGAGDIAGGALGVYGLLIAAKLGVSPAVLLRMLLNIGIDTVIGIVPLLGDIFDIGWKSNTRNVALVEAWLGDPHRVRRSSITVLAVALLSIVAVVVLVGWLVVRGLGALANLPFWS